MLRMLKLMQHAELGHSRSACIFAQPLPTKRRSDNHIDFAVDKLSGKCPKSLRLRVGKAILQLNILVLDVTEVAESLSKSSQTDFLLLGAARMPKNSYPRYLFQLLGERRMAMQTLPRQVVS